MKNATPEKVLELLVQTGLCENASEIDIDITLMKQGLDSIDFLQLYLAVEEEYGIKIPDSDMPALGSVTDIVNYTNAKN
jgi:acyl carrier protein